MVVVDPLRRVWLFWQLFPELQSPPSIEFRRRPKCRHVRCPPPMLRLAVSQYINISHCQEEEAYLWQDLASDLGSTVDMIADDVVQLSPPK